MIAATTLKKSLSDPLRATFLTFFFCVTATVLSSASCDFTISSSSSFSSTVLFAVEASFFKYEIWVPIFSKRWSERSFASVTALSSFLRAASSV
jgi:hypothetical protein